MKNLLLAIALVLLAAIAPVAAQDVKVTETPENCLAEAQAWYSAIPNIRYTIIHAIMGGTIAERFEMINDFGEIVTAITEREYPACVEDARKHYLAGLEHMKASMLAALDRDNRGAAEQSNAALFEIAYARGYLAGLGVRLYLTDRAVLDGIDIR